MVKLIGKIITPEYEIIKLNSFALTLYRTWNIKTNEFHVFTERKNYTTIY